MQDIFWPGTKTPKSQSNAFTSHLTQPKSSFKPTPPKQGQQRQQGARFGDPEKARVFKI